MSRPNHIRVLKVLFMLLMAVNLRVSANASEPQLVKSCNKLALFELRQCLGQSDYRQNNHCWSESQMAYNDCILGIVANDSLAKPAKLSKAELKQAAKLDKKLKAQTIKALLLGAANKQVYVQVLERSLSTMEQRLYLSQQHFGDRQDKATNQLTQRKQAYERFLQWVEQGVSCEQLRGKIAANVTPGSTDNRYKSKAFRELKNLTSSYCRMINR